MRAYFNVYHMKCHTNASTLAQRVLQLCDTYRQGTVPFLSHLGVSSVPSSFYAAMQCMVQASREGGTKLRITRPLLWVWLRDNVPEVKSEGKHPKDVWNQWVDLGCRWDATGHRVQGRNECVRALWDFLMQNKSMSARLKRSALSSSSASPAHPDHSRTLVEPDRKRARRTQQATLVSLKGQLAAGVVGGADHQLEQLLTDITRLKFKSNQQEFEREVHKICDKQNAKLASMKTRCDELRRAETQMFCKLRDHIKTLNGGKGALKLTPDTVQHEALQLQSKVDAQVAQHLQKARKRYTDCKVQTVRYVDKYRKEVAKESKRQKILYDTLEKKRALTPQEQVELAPQTVEDIKFDRNDVFLRCSTLTDVLRRERTHPLGTSVRRQQFFVQLVVYTNILDARHDNEAAYTKNLTFEERERLQLEAGQKYVTWLLCTDLDTLSAAERSNVFKWEHRVFGGHFELTNHLFVQGERHAQQRIPYDQHMSHIECDLLERFPKQGYLQDWDKSVLTFLASQVDEWAHKLRTMHPHGYNQSIHHALHCDLWQRVPCFSLPILRQLYALEGHTTQLREQRQDSSQLLQSFVGCLRALKFSLKDNRWNVLPEVVKNVQRVLPKAVDALTLAIQTRTTLDATMRELKAVTTTERSVRSAALLCQQDTRNVDDEFDRFEADLSSVGMADRTTEVYQNVLSLQDVFKGVSVQAIGLTSSAYRNMCQESGLPVDAPLEDVLRAKTNHMRRAHPDKTKDRYDPSVYERAKNARDDLERCRQYCDLFHTHEHLMDSLVSLL